MSAVLCATGIAATVRGREVGRNATVANGEQWPP